MGGGQAFSVHERPPVARTVVLSVAAGHIGAYSFPLDLARQRQLGPCRPSTEAPTIFGQPATTLAVLLTDRPPCAKILWFKEFCTLK